MLAGSNPTVVCRISPRIEGLAEKFSSIFSFGVQIDTLLSGLLIIAWNNLGAYS